MKTIFLTLSFLLVTMADALAKDASYACSLVNRTSNAVITKTFQISTNFEERAFNLNKNLENLPKDHQVALLAIAKTVPRCDCNYTFQYILRVFIGSDLIASHSIDTNSLSKTHISVGKPLESIFVKGDADSLPERMEGESEHYKVICDIEKYE